MRTTNAALTGVVVGIVIGSVLLAYATSPGPSKDTVLPVIAAPIQEAKRVRVPIGKGESLVVSTTGKTVEIAIWFEGVNRGKLAEIDISTRTVLMPVRPPTMWSIGGR